MLQEAADMHVDLVSTKSFSLAAADVGFGLTSAMIASMAGH